MIVESFRDRLDALRRRDSSFEGFGAYKHQYRLGPVLAPAEIVVFEERYGLRLPEDLRTFLSTVGNGGAGPGYGLNRLGLLAIPSRPALPPGDMAIVFSGGKTTYPVEFYEQAFSYDYFETLEELEAAPEILRLPNDLVDPVWEPTDEAWALYRQGALTLADYGCGLTARLLVSGPSTGTVWVFDDCDRAGITPFADFASSLDGPEVTGALSFARWYDHWLVSSGV